MYNTTSFEKYLEEVFAKNYPGTDDDMPDKFDAWLENLSQDEMIEFADEYADAKLAAGDTVNN